MRCAEGSAEVEALEAAVAGSIESGQTLEQMMETIEELQQLHGVIAAELAGASVTPSGSSGVLCRAAPERWRNTTSTRASNRPEGMARPLPSPACEWISHAPWLDICLSIPT